MSALTKRKHILIDAPLYGTGGVETHLLNLCGVLVARAEVTVAARIAHTETPLVRWQHGIPVRLLTTPFARDLCRFRFSTVWAAAVWPLQMRTGYSDLLRTVELSCFASFLRGFVRRDGLRLYSHDTAVQGVVDAVEAVTVNRRTR